MTAVDISIYGILDADLLRDSDLASLAVAAAKGGATLLQLRAKNASPEWIVATAQRLVERLRPFGIPLLINDRVDIVAESRAHGAHVGNQDMPAHQARALLGPDRILGLSIESEADAESAPVDCIDYACIGGVYPTTSKLDEGVIGLDGWARCAAILRRRRPDLPVGAIAGIGPANAADVMAAGADGIAVISAMFLQGDAEAAARRLGAIVETARKR
jgi:thiamine-phosphate pyrophosphorylase